MVGHHSGPSGAVTGIADQGERPESGISPPRETHPSHTRAGPQDVDVQGGAGIIVCSREKRRRLPRCVEQNAIWRGANGAHEAQINDILSGRYGLLCPLAQRSFSERREESEEWHLM